MATAGSHALPKMAAGGPALRPRGAGGTRERRRAESRGPALPRPQRRRGIPGSCAGGSAGPLERGSSRTPSSQSSSAKTAGKRPSKRQKCEKSSPVKPELEGGACGSENVAASGETPKASDGDGCAEDPGGCDIIQQKKGESIPGTNEVKEIKEHNVSLEPHAVTSSSAASRMGSGENLQVCSEEERSCGSMFSDGSSWEDADLPKKQIQLDSSVFLNEDSNQPMPMHRFFGDMAVLQDLPAAALPSTMKSRREFRKLHFIAKEEEEEEKDNVV